MKVVDIDNYYDHTNFKISRRSRQTTDKMRQTCFSDSHQKHLGTAQVLYKGLSKFQVDRSSRHYTQTVRPFSKN